PNGRSGFTSARNHCELTALAAPNCRNLFNRLSTVGAARQTLLSYIYMLNDRIAPDAYTFPSLLKACSSLGSLSHALTIHQHIIVSGGDFIADAYIASSLVHVYAKWGHVDSARQVFDRMPYRNVVPWTMIVGCYSQMGDVDKSFSMYNQMQHEGIRPNSVTVLGLLSGISQLYHLQCVHCCVVQLGFEVDIVVVNSLLNVYARCGGMEAAQQLFDAMHRWDIVSWNSLVSGYSKTGNVSECVELLNRMRRGETKPDQHTFGSVASVIADKSTIESGKSIHAQIITSGFESDVHIETTLMNMYLKLGNMDESFQLYDRIEDRDVVSWTAMIAGLVQNDRGDRALSEFHQMLRARVTPSSATIASALAACAQLGSFNSGTSIHAYIIRQRMQVDVAAMNSLLTMYAKCGHLIQCQALFDMMSDRDVVSWNGIVAGYAQNGYLNKAFSLFSKMREARQRPDSISVVSLLQACASTGTLHQGKWVHNYILRNGLRPSISVDTALIDMYSKCGDMEAAQRCFDGMPEQDLVSWSVIIAGYGSHGKGETALRIYLDFLQTGIKPNPVLFLSVLSACSHAGLVPEGLRVFQSMNEDFGIEPKLEHHACVVDLLCRAARVQDAYRFVKAMLSQPTIDILGILLDACRTHRDVDLGEAIAGEILQLKPENAGNYVQLAHSYAAISRWDGVCEAWRQMKSLGLKKVPGWSSIELHGTATLFFVDHTSHPQHEEMILMLKILDIEMRNRNSKFHLYSQ
ncbi:pentatricopeptide repeat-containing protein At4g04370, partial [Magnolia sinica]|uniref:pentatricopeptide repeat-containing protein At4g04370 n=1 Tax=Magnolia sinica TaxID=86752 RepID=UPI00265991F5